jgi:ABC-2 type transport system permease protein
MKLMLLREFREGWRSFRLPGVLLLALFFALLEPPSLKYMDVIMGMFAEGITIILPPPTPEAAFMAFASDLSSMVLIAAIVVTMGIVAREQHNGLTEWFLTRPVSRQAYVISKAVYLIVTTMLIVIVSSILCAVYTSTLIGPLSVSGIIYAIILLTTQLMLPLTLTMVVSAVTGIAGAAAGAGVFTMFLVPMLGWVFQGMNANWLPVHLANHLPQVLSGSADTNFWLAIATSWLLIATLFFAMNMHFSRKQI